MASSQQLVKFENQVAGHDNILQLSTNDLMVLKPSTQQEREFYESSQQHEDFMEWIPDCYGTLHASTESEKQLLNEGQDATTLQTEAVTIHANNEATNQPADRDDILLHFLWRHLCLENILNGFTRPCIMDLKLGYRLYEDTADEAKRSKMIKNAKGTTIESLGLRISGMKTFNSIERHYTSYPKQYGRGRTKDNFVNGLLSFFYPTYQLDDDIDTDSDIPRHCVRSRDNNDDTLGPNTMKSVTKKKIEWIVEHFMDTVTDMKAFIEQHHDLRLVGCSLLLVYEGDAAAAQRVWKRMLDEDRQQETAKDDDSAGEESEQVDPKLCDIRLIDFGRSRWLSGNTEQDPTFLNALDNLVAMLDQVLEQSPS